MLWFPRTRRLATSRLVHAKQLLHHWPQVSERRESALFRRLLRGAHQMDVEQLVGDDKRHINHIDLANLRHDLLVSTCQEHQTRLRHRWLDSNFILDFLILYFIVFHTRRLTTSFKITQHEYQSSKWRRRMQACASNSPLPPTPQARIISHPNTPRCCCRRRLYCRFVSTYKCLLPLFLTL